MFSKCTRFIAVAVLVFSLGCGDDGPSGPTTSPNIPGNVQIVVGNTTVTISWNASGGATSYTIYWNTTGGVTTADTKIEGATSPYTHTSLTNGNTYYYAVSATNAAGESSLSAEVSATPSAQAQLTIAASKDNTLYEDAAGAWSNGAGDHMFVGVTTDPANGGQSGEPAEIRRTVIAFDVAGSGIPAGSTIDSVFLVVNVSRLMPATTNVTVHELTADWGEGTSDPLSPNEGGGTNSSFGDATWIHTFYPSALWTTAGGDYDGTASGTLAIAGIGKFTAGTTANMVADVQGWLDTPATNFGWILIGDESTDATATRLDSRTNATAANQPQLIVYYTGP